mgnify:CR=1 FL=1
MGPLPTYRVGMNNFWRALTVNATGTSVVVTVPASTMASGGTNRIVVTEIFVSANKTAGATTSIVLRAATTTTARIYVADIPGATGTIQADRTGMWLPLPDNENLSLVVGGALTGTIDVLVSGIFLPSTTPAADKYTGVT